MIPIRTNAPNDGSPVVTMGLILVNLAVFIYQTSLAGRAELDFVLAYALVPKVYSHPLLARQAGLDPSNFLPFITNTFMHGSWLHIAFNMWTLWLFGGPLEEALGKWRFLLVYLLFGLAGSLAHLLANWGSPVPVLGASGAIAGVLGTFTVLYPRARVGILQPIFIFPLLLHVPALLYTAFWFGLQVWEGWASLGQAGAGVAWWAHIGGFVAGLAAGYRLRHRRITQPAVWWRDLRTRQGRDTRSGPWG
ncbi:MAG: rhomboid family intramembrane serine protease [Rhodobacterales bacterium]|nr:rhomboid family intramembrane serine protease [Rhodobacterales bacterium]